MPDPFKTRVFLTFIRKIWLQIVYLFHHDSDSSPYPSGLRYFTICMNTLKVSINRMYIF